MADWRTAVAVIIGTGWGWMLTLPRLQEMSHNPGIVSSWEWLVVLGVDLVLVAIDAWALNSLYNALRAIEWENDRAREREAERQGESDRWR